MGLFRDPTTRKLLLLLCVLVCTLTLAVSVAINNYVITTVSAVGILGSAIKLAIIGKQPET